MLASEAARPSMTGQDQSLPGGLLVCLVLIARDTLVGVVTARSRVAKKMLEGQAVLLRRNGVIFEAVRKKHRASCNDVEQPRREADFELRELHSAFHKADVRVSIQKQRHAD